MKRIIIAWMLVFLIPLVSATSITQIQMYGESQVPGFIKSYDTFYAECVVEITGETNIGLGQVKFFPLEFPPEECTPVTDGFKCKVNLGATSYSPSKTDIPIKLYSNTNELLLTENTEVIVDGFGPSITISLESGISGPGQVDVSFNITDTAYANSIECSGIGGVVFNVFGGPSESFSYNTTDCTTNGIVQVGITEDQEELRFCGTAYDRLGQNGPQKCLTVDVDFIAPVIQDETFDFIYNGVSANVMLPSNRQIVLDARVLIQEENLSYVHGEFNGEDYEATCALVNVNLWQCVWEDLLYTLTDDAPISVTINARDDSGNTDESQIPYQFLVDVTGPIPQSILINGETTGWVGLVINEVAITFTEQGTLMPSNVFLDASGVGGNAKMPATVCTRTEDSWTCSWYAIPTGEGLTGGIIKAHADTIDDAGNLMQGTIEATVQIDQQPPVIQLFNITQPEAEIELPPQMFLEQVPIVANAVVLETGPSLTVRIYPPFSNTTNATVTSSCTSSNGTFSCGIIIDKLPPGYYNISYIFEDAAKNIASQIVEFIVVDLKNESADYWLVNAIERIPTAVDRSTAPYIEHQLLYTIGMTSKVTGVTTNTDIENQDTVLPASEVQLISARLGNCSGDTQYTREITLIDNTVDEFLMINVILKEMEMPLNNLSITCDVELWTLASNGEDAWVNNLPEIETIPLTVPFFNTELPDEILAGKINRILESKAIQNTEGGLFQTLDWVMDMFDTVSRIDQIMLSFGAGLEGLALFCDGITIITLGTAAPVCNTLDFITDGIMVIHDLFAPVEAVFTCKTTGWDLILGEDNKISKAIESVPMTLGGKFMEDKLGYSTDQLTNPRRSLTASIATLCIPGIYENLMQRRDVECSYAYCIQEASRLGVKQTYCDELHSYSQCVVGVEEWLPLTPLTTLWEDTSNAANAAMQSPIHLVSSAFGVVCQFDLNIPIVDSICGIALMGEALNGVNMAINVVENFGSYGGDFDYCEMVEGYNGTG